MAEEDPRAVLARLIHERGEDCASLSRLLGRNPAYVQQFIKRGTPRRLAEADRARLARYFGIPETWLGASAPAIPAMPRLLIVPLYDVAASAGPGTLLDDRRSAAGLGFSEEWLRRLRPEKRGTAGLSLIQVRGHSMQPTLMEGDDILVDADDLRLRDGIYVLRIDDVLLVKRLRCEGKGFAVVSDNPEAGPVDLVGDYAIIGRVLWAGRRL